VGEDGVHELSQLCPRLQAELVAEPADELAVRRGCLHVASGAVERAHAQFDRPFSKRRLGGQAFDFREGAGVVAELELDGEALFDRAPAQRRSKRRASHSSGAASSR
jgi:hypothetical protein